MVVEWLLDGMNERSRILLALEVALDIYARLRSEAGLNGKHFNLFLKFVRLIIYFY